MDGIISEKQTNWQNTLMQWLFENLPEVLNESTLD